MQLRAVGSTVTLSAATSASTSRKNYPIAVGSIWRVRSVVLASFVPCLVSAAAMVAFGQGSISRASADPVVQKEPYLPTLKFEVASIRQCPAGPKRNGIRNPLHVGRFIGTCVWAEQLIGLAYGIDWNTQIAGGPNWVKVLGSNEVRFEVQATSDRATDDKLAKLSNGQAKLEKEHMLQELLKDRFALKVHIAERPEPAFTMTVAKHGPKLQKGEPPAPRPAHFAGPWPAPIEPYPDLRGITLVAHGATMGELAERLQFYLGKRFFDQTGLTGTYDFTLRFYKTYSYMEPDVASMWPPIEIAIKDQLGLQLKAAKVRLQVVVIDRIERPSPN